MEEENGEGMCVEKDLVERKHGLDQKVEAEKSEKEQREY